MRLWSEQDASLHTWLSRAIQGEIALDELDLVAQQRLVGLTRRLLIHLLRPTWMRSAPILAHARAYFPDFAPSSEPDDELRQDLQFKDAATVDYLSYVLLDFARLDRDLETLPLMQGYCVAEHLGITERFGKLIAKSSSSTSASSRS